MRDIRKFITGKDADSYIHISGGYEGYQLKLADCDRAVKIWFSFATKALLFKSLVKLNNIINPLLELQEELQRKYDATP